MLSVSQIDTKRKYDALPMKVQITRIRDNLRKNHMAAGGAAADSFLSGHSIKSCMNDKTEVHLPSHFII